MEANRIIVEIEQSFNDDESDKNDSDEQDSDDSVVPSTNDSDDAKSIQNDSEAHGSQQASHERSSTYGFDDVIQITDDVSDIIPSPYRGGRRGMKRQRKCKYICVISYTNSSWYSNQTFIIYFSVTVADECMMVGRVEKKRRKIAASSSRRTMAVSINNMPGEIIFFCRLA